MLDKEVDLNGEPHRTRTCNRLIKRLISASTGFAMSFSFKNWLGGHLNILESGGRIIGHHHYLPCQLLA